MAYELEGEASRGYEMLGPEGRVVEPDETPTFRSRVKRKVSEAGESAAGGLQAARDILLSGSPWEKPDVGFGERVSNALRVLGGVFSPVQAALGVTVGAPFEHAAAGVFPEETSELIGTGAELLTPLGIGALAKAGRARLPQSAVGIAASELLGIPREPIVPTVERVEPLTRPTPVTSRYRYSFGAAPVEGEQIGLRLPTEPRYRPARPEPEVRVGEYPSLGESPFYTPRGLETAPVEGKQFELFAPIVSHSKKVQAFREITGRSPSAKELQTIKELDLAQTRELANHNKEVADLQAQLSNPAGRVPPTRALASATEEMRHVQAAEALGARHSAQDIRESIQDNMTKAMNQWYTKGRPGGTTLAGSVAGSYMGFDQDEDGNWVFDPAKALLGTTLGVSALTLAQRAKSLGQSAQNFSRWYRQVQAGKKIPTHRTEDLTNKLVRKIIFPHTAAEVEPAFAPVYNTAMKFFENRSYIGGMFAEKLGDVTKGVSNKLKSTLVAGSLLKKEFTPAQLSQMGHTADDIRQYGQIRDALDFSLDALERHFVQSGIDPVKAAGVVNQLRRTGYFPQSRFGPYKIAVEDAQGNLIGFFTDETKLAHQKAKSVVQGNLKPGEKLRAYYKPDPPSAEFVGMDVQVMSLLGQVDEAVKAALGTTPQGQQISQLIGKATHRMSGFPTHMLQQKSLPGFSVDVPRVLSSYGRSLSQYISRREAVDKSAPYITALAAAGKEHWADYSKKYIREVTNPTGDMGPLREGLFLYYLAGKVSSALVNLSGYLTLGYPVIGRYTKNATKQWTRGLKEAFKSDSSLSPELAGGLRLAKLEGVVADPTTQELLGTASGRSPTLRGATDLAGALFGRAESSIRRASYIAGHNIATQELGKKGDDAHEFAKRIVREANLDYSKADRPELVRAGWKAPFGTFRLFQWNVLSKFKDAIKRGEYGTLARHVGTMGAVAGLVGMPGAKLLIDVARDQGYDFPTWVREKFGRGGEVALRGPVYAAGSLWGEPEQGIDLSGSAGLGDVVPSELFGNPVEGVAKLLGGVLVDPLVRARKAGTLAMQREGMRGLETMLPEALRSASVATRAGRSGQFTTSFDEPIVSAAPFDVAMRGLGFQPSAVSRAYEREAAEKSLRYAATSHVERYYRLLAKAIVSRDRDAVQAALTMIQEHNATAAPEAVIALGSTAASSAIRRHVLQLTQPEGTEIKALPRRARARYQLIQEAHR